MGSAVSVTAGGTARLNRDEGRSAWVLADEPTPGPLGLLLRHPWESRLIEMGLAGGEILRTIAAEHSLGLALSPDGQRLYLPHGASRRVTVLAGGSFEEKITVPGRAYGVAFAPRPCVVDASPSKPRSRPSRATPAERSDHRPTHRHVTERPSAEL